MKDLSQKEILSITGGYFHLFVNDQKLYDVDQDKRYNLFSCLLYKHI